MSPKTHAQHLAILKAHNAWRRGATLKLEVSPEEIGQAIDCAIDVMDGRVNADPTHELTDEEIENAYKSIAYGPPIAPSRMLAFAHAIERLVKGKAQ